jgi:hypothetical protein
MIQEDTMDAPEFDHLTRAISTRLPRRALTGLLGLSSLGVVGLTEAGKKKKRKKIRRNIFGCVDVGKFCKNAGQCCSGICKGKKGKKKCRAHDESTCLPGQNVCVGAMVGCITTAGIPGQCGVTTGRAPYCFATGECFPCSKDTDCELPVGFGAACLACPSCFDETPKGTACVRTTAAS